MSYFDARSWKIPISGSLLLSSYLKGPKMRKGSLWSTKKQRTSLSSSAGRILNEKCQTVINNKVKIIGRLRIALIPCNGFKFEILISMNYLLALLFGQNRIIYFNIAGFKSKLYRNSGFHWNFCRQIKSLYEININYRPKI